MRMASRRMKTYSPRLPRPCIRIPPARIRAWATNHVRNRADVLVSFRPGYDHGSRILSDIVRLEGTHGGLEKSASIGFAMATYPLAPSIRLEDLLPADLLEEAGKSASR